MRRLLRSTICMASGNWLCTSAALIAGAFLATTFTLSAAVAKAESPLQVPDSAQIVVLKTGDIKSGSGVLRTPAGLFDGSWEKSEMKHGRLKTAAGDVVRLDHYDDPDINYKNGDKYEREIDRVTLLPHGDGTLCQYRKFLIWEIREKYSGMFKAGKYHGKGELTAHKLFGEDLVYVGNFVEGVREGWMTVSKTETQHIPLRYERWEGGRCVEVIKY